MLGLLNTVLSKGNTLLTYVKDGLVMANRFLTPPKLTFPVDASAKFNGTSDYIDVDPLPLSNWDNFTYSAWVNIDTFQTSNVLGFGSTSSNTPLSILEIRSDATINFFHRNDSGVFAQALSVETLNANQWYFLVATRENGTSTLYIDGSVSASGTQNVSTPTLNTFNIGRLERTSPINYLNGNLANVAIWNRALSSDEINSVMWKTYEQVSATESNGLQAWYKLSADEVLSGDSTATLTTYANANTLTFEAPACVQTALNAFPDITDARLYSANYDIRVSADGGNVESLNCVETELNALLV